MPACSGKQLADIKPGGNCMNFKLRDEKTGGDLLLFTEEAGFDRLYFSRDRFNKYFTIAWNPGDSQTITIGPG